MEGKVKDVIHCIRGQFYNYCIETRREQEFCKVEERLLAGTRESSEVLVHLVEIIEHGTAFDLECFLRLEFNLPVGMRFNLTSMLNEQCRRIWREQQVDSGTKLVSSESGRLEHLLRGWKCGSIAPDEVFSGIFQMVGEGTLPLQEARNLTDLILREGGRPSCSVAVLAGRCQTASSLGTFLEVSGIHPTLHSAEIHTHEGDFIRVHSDQLTRSTIYNVTSECMVSTAAFHWEHVGELDRLLFYSVLGGPELPCSAPPADHDYLLNHPLNKPTLFIGDSIRMHDLVVDISSVIMVDSLTPTADVAVPRFALLVEGALSPGANYGLTHRNTDPGQIQRAFDVYRDGATEVNSPRSLAGGDASSADSNDEEHQHSIPPYETDRRYLVIFVAVLDGVPVVECACALRDHVLHDQIPTSIRYAAPSLAVVSGTNGLLGLVRAGLPEPASTARDVTMETAGRQPILCAAGPRAGYSWFPLVEDSLQPPGWADVALSHAGDSAITAVDACCRGSADGVPEVVLVSGDSRGVVCLWAVDPPRGRGQLRCPPFQVTSEARRVWSLTLAASGEHVALGLLDRLLLLGVSVIEGAADDGAPRSNNGGGETLYVRSCLDMLCGGAYARYGVAFGPTFLRVWRVMNEVRSPPCPAASHRTELDSFPEHESGRLRSHTAGVLFEDLGTYSIDEAMAEEAAALRSVPVGRRINSPLSPQSPNPPPPPPPPPLSEHRKPAVQTANHQPGISITTWLHLSVDVFAERSGTSAEEIAAACKMGGSQRFALSRRGSAQSGIDLNLSSPRHREDPAGKAGGPLSPSDTSGRAFHHMMEVDDHLLPMYEPEANQGPLPSPSITAPLPTVLLPPQGLATSHHHHDRRDEAHVVAAQGIPGVQALISRDAVVYRVSTDTATTPALAQPADSDSGLVAGVVLDHRFRHHSYFTAMGMVRPSRSLQRRRPIDVVSLRKMMTLFQHDTSEAFLRVRTVLSVLAACFQTPSIGILAAAMELPLLEVARLIRGELSELLYLPSDDKRSLVAPHPSQRSILKWLCSEDRSRAGELFWIDAGIGHNLLCALYLRYSGNKSVAVEHTWQDYLRTYGPAHLRHSTRGLRLLTANIRKIDETANLRAHLPRQIGYIVGLYEIYARRVGLRGRIPAELGQLRNLRVLSMGNNHLSGELPESLGQLRNLQRIVLHQNNLRGDVPRVLGELGCIVNLAGNPLLHHGPDVPVHERLALMDLYSNTRGAGWHTKSYWCSSQPVAKWYKVGVLSSHVHSIVMSSNGMEGRIPTSISQLSCLRMIELATMPGLIGVLPRELCSLTTLRRLCICRCGLTGRIPNEIGQLVGLEELQLFGNSLTGAVPESLGNLTNLKLLSLGEYTGGNSFQPDPLPACLSSLRSLEALFMANCNIRGPLPDWIGSLTELRQLDLQRNMISGSLPPTIGNLQNLLYLNIKDNTQLTGRLPLVQLLSLSKLNRLSLVHCSFAETDHALEALRMHLPRCKVWI